MSTWRITNDRALARSQQWQELPRPAIAQLYGPEQYIASDALIEAINTAILLGQPLLLTGEPGCGKTEAGNFLAWKLGLGSALRFDIKSTTTARDLFYIPDTVADSTQLRTQRQTLIHFDSLPSKLSDLRFCTQTNPP